MYSVEPKDLTTPQTHRLLLGGVGPRPIALVSTISPDGVRNLSPFSFFGAFGANPPIVAFSPALRGRDGSKKDTLNNLRAVPECVIHAVTHDIVHQVNLASAEYPPDVDEFAACGLTPIPSEIVRPCRVAESPFHMECQIRQIIPLGESGASGNLIICEVVKLHVDERLFAGELISPDRMDPVARMGGDWYCRASGAAIFQLPKPTESPLPMGYDKLPDWLRSSASYTPADLARFALASGVPPDDDAISLITRDRSACSAEPLMQSAKTALESGDRGAAWRFAIAAHLLESRDPRVM